MIEYIVGVGGLLVVLLFLSKGYGIIRPTERGIIERFGKFHSVKQPGLVLLIPFVDELMHINVTEQMVDAKQQEVITKDSLNAGVDAQIYFRVRSDDESVKKSQYAVYNYGTQIVQLTRTTLRNIIGNMSLTEANSQRSALNVALANELSEQTETWGIQVVRAELKEIQPPKDVQDTMNKVVIAEKEKTAAVDFATAIETKADGNRRAAIKEAEGKRAAAILNAEGEAKAITIVAEANAEQIKVVNESAEKYFKGNAIDYKKYQVTETVLKDNVKYIVPAGADLVNVVDGSIATFPMKKK